MKSNNTPRHCDMSIKICGMADPDNIRSVAALTPMLMGFIFYDRSLRTAIGLDEEVVRDLPDYIHPVAVFVDESVDCIIATCERYGIKIVQLHGSESPQMCRKLRAKGYTVFKAMGIADEADMAALRPYDGVADVMVLDAKTSAHGGSGRKFAWDLLDSYDLETPFFLSGGIGPDDVDAIVAAMRPGMVGIDINSRFETAPGRKNIGALANFILTLRKFNEDEPSATPVWEKR